MAMFEYRVEVRFRAGVLDPQGETIRSAMHQLGYDPVKKVATGKVFWVVLEADSAEQAKTIVAELADRLLANPVIEQFALEVVK